MATDLVPINAENSIWDKTSKMQKILFGIKIYDEVTQNIEDLINNITTEHQQDN